jgi:hypothetical protein
MTDNRRYNLRLLERFFYYDSIGSQQSYEWQKDAIVTNPDEIALLESRHAPTERIFIHTEFRR